MPPVVPLLQPGQPPGSAGNNARDTDIPRRLRIRARQCWNPSVTDVIVNTRPDVGGLGRRNSPRVHDALETAFTISVISRRVRSHSVQAVWLYWIPDYFDAHSSASAFALNLHDGSTSIAERAGWSIPQLSDLTLRAVREPDAGRRLELYRFIQTQVQQRSPIVIALQERSQVVMRANVRGYRQGLNADMVYYDRVTK
jgi:hypothetical protein